MPGSIQQTTERPMIVVLPTTRDAYKYWQEQGLEMIIQVTTDDLEEIAETITVND